jgi:pantoate--beta-alanine ligase
MKIFNSPEEIQNYIKELKSEGKKISFVPTMGYLHEGHLSLMREAKKYGDVVVVSIFVNPTQFGPNEDLDKYPRDFKGDEAKCESVGVDIIFYPTVENMYPEEYQTYVTVEKVTKNLCGLSRPVHFRGVATVVSKLFNIVLPDFAFFGEKDFQQLVVIKRMVKDLNFPVKVVGCPIVRESDGLAMSSRNKYLSQEERKQALCLFKAIKRVKELFEKGERDSIKLTDEAKKIIEKEPLASIDYVKIVDIESMEDINGNINKNALIALAVKVGNTRLIDNCKLILEGSNVQNYA